MLSKMSSPDRNDFLRPCNCVHPSEEDCEKCIEEADVKKDSDPCDEKAPKKKETKTSESQRKV